jgi:hypothetical protein
MDTTRTLLTVLFRLGKAKKRHKKSQEKTVDKVPRGTKMSADWQKAKFISLHVSYETSLTGACNELLLEFRMAKS